LDYDICCYVTMEVHHHPEVEKKGFKEYLLEGLMIFLAVTMGFFAESLRENISSREKEKEYIVSFEKNLEKDKAQLIYVIADNKKKLDGLDTLLTLSDKAMTDPANRKLVYNYSNFISWLSVFISNDATMTQLKNSGGLQYIKHSHVADSVAKYDQEVRGIYTAENNYTKFTNDATDAMTDILVFGINKNKTTLRSNPKEQYPLLTNTPAQIQLFFNKVKLEEGWTRNYVLNLQERVPYTDMLIRLLKKEYDLK